MKEKPNIFELFIKPLIATILMSFVVILTEKLLSYINLENAVTTIVTIIVAIIAYAVFLVICKVMSKEEIKQLPYGNKICQVIEKVKKI